MFNVLIFFAFYYYSFDIIHDCRISVASSFIIKQLSIGLFFHIYIQRRHQIQSGETSLAYKKFERAGGLVDDLIYYYQAVIRPLLEYASVVSPSSLLKELNAVT